MAKRSLRSPLTKRTDDETRSPIATPEHAADNRPFARWDDVSPKQGSAGYISPTLPVSQYWANLKGKRIDSLYWRSYYQINEKTEKGVSQTQQGLVTTEEPITNSPCRYALYWKLTVRGGFKWPPEGPSSLNSKQDSPLYTVVIRGDEERRATQNLGHEPLMLKKDEDIKFMYDWLEDRLARPGRFNPTEEQAGSVRSESHGGNQASSSAQEEKWQDPLYMGSLQLLVGDGETGRESGVTLTYRLLDISDTEHPVKEIDDGSVYDLLPDICKNQGGQQPHEASYKQRMDWLRSDGTGAVGRRPASADEVVNQSRAHDGQSRSNDQAVVDMENALDAEMSDRTGQTHRVADAIGGDASGWSHSSGGDGNVEWDDDSEASFNNA